MNIIACGYVKTLVNKKVFSANARLGTKSIVVDSTGHMKHCIISPMWVYIYHPDKTSKILWNRYWVMVIITRFKT